MGQGVLSFFIGPGARAHLLTTRKRAVIWPAAIVRSPEGAALGIAFPAQYRQVSRRQQRLGHRGRGQSDGAWGRSATNKLCRVYTGALLATTTTPYKKN